MVNTFERRLRSRILGFPFVVTNALTRYEIFGRENLLAAVARHRETGRGLITVSNHQSLFDDPMVLAALMGLSDFTVESKYWWSTPCQSNFSPKGDSVRDRFVRYFSDVANMVFMARRSKSGRYPIPPRYLDVLASHQDGQLLDRIRWRASALRLEPEAYLRRFVTEGDDSVAALNQVGMVEACARVDLGDWLHFFPEATRGRKLDLGAPKRGVGKVLYHCQQAEVLPLCFCGMHTVLPVGAVLPRPMQRVVVFVGEPVSAHKLVLLRQGAPCAERYQDLATAAWEPIQSLWPLARARYERQRPMVTPFSLPHRRATRVDERRAPAVSAPVASPVLDAMGPNPPVS